MPVMQYRQQKQRLHIITLRNFGLGIPTIDLYSVFQVQPAPLTLFPYPYAHYNEKGYRLAAKGILDYLDAEDFGRTHHK